MTTTTMKPSVDSTSASTPARIALEQWETTAAGLKIAGAIVFAIFAVLLTVVTFSVSGTFGTFIGLPLVMVAGSAYLTSQNKMVEKLIGPKYARR